MFRSFWRPVLLAGAVFGSSASPVAAQADVWIDEFSVSNQMGLARPLFRGHERTGEDARHLDAARSIRLTPAILRGRSALLIRASSGAHFLSCSGGARSWNPDQDITVFAQIYVDGIAASEISSAQGYTPSVGVTANIPYADYNRLAECYLWAAGAQAQASTTLAAQLVPFTSIGSDPGNWRWEDKWRRDIWYQIWHADGRPWGRGGEVWEQWFALSNPCGIQVQTGIGSVNTYGQFLDTYWHAIVDPACAYVGDQRYTLTTANYLEIRSQRWRYDTSGIWMQ